MIKQTKLFAGAAVLALLSACAAPAAQPAAPAAAPAAPAAAPAASTEIIIGLITKTESNPFFVKMREGATKMAEEKGAKLLTGAGKQDGDNAGQVAALENMVAAGAKTILITPSDSKAILPAIKKARDAGVLVIALDSPTDPADGTDALFATNNYQAGILIGQYAKGAMAGKTVKIAALDLFPGHPVGAQRHNGFLQGFGLKSLEATSNELAMPAEVVCAADSFGDQAKGQAAMETCLQKDPGINLVYTINEPAAAGAYTALKAAGKEKDVVIVSVDGGCAGVANVKAGIIAATSQQYPLKMAAMGVEAGVEYAKTGKKPSGYTDTGVTLIADKAIAGVDSKDTTVGMDLCWGDKPAADAGAAPAAAGGEVIIGLITKTESNPFFVKMREGATKMAADKGAKLLTGAGAKDGDNAGQVAALENMVAAGAKTILITPSDSKAILPAIKKAQEAGVLVIALDSPTDPVEGTDALFATNNYQAGILIGQYAKAKLGGKPVKIATLDLFPGHPVGAQRHNGFVQGFGLKSLEATSNELAMPAEVVCAADSFGDQAKGQAAMETCLQKDPEINLVYTINEPAAAGAYTALKAAGKEKDVVIVSVDGGCAGVKNVDAGVIAATSQQYPLLMASMGVEAGVEYAKTGKKPSGYTDTGVTLIAKEAVAGVESKDTVVGMDLCWGEK